MIFLEEIIKNISTEFTYVHAKLSYFYDFNCNWLDSSIDFDKRNEATNTVTEIEDELKSEI